MLVKYVMMQKNGGSAMAAKNVISKLLKITGMSSRSLSKELGFCENAICYYVNEKRRPNIFNCYRIIKFAKRYNLSISLEEIYPDA